jgi:hypothetical protein
MVQLISAVRRFWNKTVMDEKGMKWEEKGIEGKVRRGRAWKER